VAECLLCPQANRIATATKTTPSTAPSPIATLSPVESFCRGCEVDEFDALGLNVDGCEVGEFDALGLNVDVGSI
jgi:hypothetical protein